MWLLCLIIIELLLIFSLSKRLVYYIIYDDQFMGLKVNFVIFSLERIVLGFNFPYLSALLKNVDN
jgi:hypothetical protein